MRSQGNGTMVFKLFSILFLFLIYSGLVEAAERNLLFMLCKDPANLLYDIYSAGPDLSYKKIIPDGIIPTWSPDGTKIAFLLRRKMPDRPHSFQQNLCFANQDGSQIIRVKTKTPFEEVFDLSWAPDAGKIAWATGSHLVISALDEEILSYEAKNQIMEAEWLGDGKRIVFLDTGSGINLFDLERKKNEVISPDGFFPRILPGQNKLIYLRKEATMEMWYMDIDERTSGALVKGIVVPFPKKNLYTFSRDGQKIIFYSGKEGDEMGVYDLGVYDINNRKVQYHKNFSGISGLGIMEAASYDGSKIAGLFGSGEKIEYAILNLKDGKKSVIRQLQRNEIGKSHFLIFLRHMDW